MKSKTFFFALATLAAATFAQAQDVAAGESKAAMCIGCHGIKGYQASFPEVHRVPRISGQGAKYIVASLNAYKKGDRKHPTMRAIATSLTEQDMLDLAAYYEQHKPSGVESVADVPEVQPSAEVAQLLTKGACASCHGANYSKPIDGSYPKLAGQYPDYLYVSLKAYKEQNHSLLGRNNAIMGAQVQQFTLKELREMSKYLGSLPTELYTVPQSRFR